MICNVVVSGLAVTTTAATAAVGRGPRRSPPPPSRPARGSSSGSARPPGVPFGRYRYTDALRPVVAGVPAVVPLAWFAMAVPARETAHAVLGGHSTAALGSWSGAAALTAWDLFLDPQMTAEGYWRWRGGGGYRGIPSSTSPGGSSPGWA